MATEELDGEEAKNGGGCDRGLRDESGPGRKGETDDDTNANAETDYENTGIVATPVAHHHGRTEPFKTLFPVTLIDSAGQRWNVTYETTRRDNLHSGELFDGWETFCIANGLKVGDEVEFTRMEAHELHGEERHNKEAIARVVTHKKRQSRFES